MIVEINDDKGAAKMTAPRPLRMGTMIAGMPRRNSGRDEVGEAPRLVWDPPGIRA